MSQAVRDPSDPYIGGNCEGDSLHNCLPRTVNVTIVFVAIDILIFISNHIYLGEPGKEIEIARLIN